MYVKYISETQIEYPPKNKDNIINYNLDTDLLIQDGYKEFIPVVIPETNRRYHINYVENDDNVAEVIVYDETQEDADTREATAREDNFKTDFFNTSLGWIRRQVNMANGSTKDFLSDLLPIISMALSSGTATQIITYTLPDFTHDIEDWTLYQEIKTVTPQFIQDCFNQLSADFGAINNN